MPAPRPCLAALRQRLLMAALLAVMVSPVVAQAQGPEKDQADTGHVQMQPKRGKIGPLTADLAEGELKVSGDYIFLNKQETQEVMRLTHAVVTGTERGAVAPIKTGDWEAYFSFEDIGYVKDDEKDSIDSDAILAQYEASSKARNERNPQDPQWSVVGWREKPHYNSATHNLEWCIEFKVGGEPLLNHKIKMLGRRGVMDVTVACSPQTLAPSLVAARAMLGGYSYKTGGKYEEWTTGDKVAAVGLTALVAGGVLAAAAKSGLLAKLIKPILIGVVALGGVIARGWKSLFGRKS